MKTGSDSGRSLVASVVQQRCPRCREGRLFKESNPYKTGALGAMPEQCSVCGQPFQLEPSFYYGSMYVSYGYTVAIFVAVLVLAYGVFGLGIWGVVGILAAVLLALGPVLFRLSRSTWIHMFVRYEPGKRDGSTSEERAPTPKI